MDMFTKKDSMASKEEEMFTVDSLLWPKNELLLIDRVHFILKDLGFGISTGVNNHTVDRIVKIPEIEVSMPSLRYGETLYCICRNNREFSENIFWIIYCLKIVDRTPRKE
jgi:hypothetical protein